MSAPTYGGQAVMEGVMIRGQRHYAIAVRHPSGRIVTHTERLTGRVYTNRLFKLPLLRGPIVLWDSLSLGVRALMFSANVALDEGSEGEKVDLGGGTMWGTMALAMAVSVALFFVGPAVLMSAVIDNFVGSALISNLVEKVIRLGLVVGYIGAIGLVPDIRRVFAYHGAEHKAINAFEDGVALDVEGATRYGTAHPRCGTSFLLVVVVISFLAFSLLGQPPMLERIISRIILIPIVAAVAYELIKLGAAHSGRSFVRAVMAPGLWLQRMTTREPDASQVEVALVALRLALAADGVDRPEAATAEARTQAELSVP